MLEQLNIAVFELINGLAGRSAIFDFIGVFFAEYFQYVLGTILLLVVLLAKNKAKSAEMALVAVVSALAARFGVKNLILLFYSNPRPYAVPEGRQLVLTPGEDFQSFPSGHALFFFAAATAIWCYDKKLGPAFFAAAAMIGLARIFVGVHWPSDILAGAALGILTGWLTFKAANLVLKKKSSL